MLLRRISKHVKDQNWFAVAIAQNLVRKLGGSLSGRVVNHQTEFTLELPLTASEDA